jgi:hypothetical protein
MVVAHYNQTRPNSIAYVDTWTHIPLDPSYIVYFILIIATSRAGFDNLVNKVHLGMLKAPSFDPLRPGWTLYNAQCGGPPSPFNPQQLPLIHSHPPLGTDWNWCQACDDLHVGDYFDAPCAWRTNISRSFLLPPLDLDLQQKASLSTLYPGTVKVISFSKMFIDIAVKDDQHENAVEMVQQLGSELRKKGCDPHFFPLDFGQLIRGCKTCGKNDCHDKSFYTDHLCPNARPKIDVEREIRDTREEKILKKRRAEKEMQRDPNYHKNRLKLKEDKRKLARKANWRARRGEESKEEEGGDPVMEGLARKFKSSSSSNSHDLPHPPPNACHQWWYNKGTYCSHSRRGQKCKFEHIIPEVAVKPKKVTLPPSLGSRSARRARPPPRSPQGDK